MSSDVAVVTPWYPNRALPARGAFVYAMVEATAPGCDRMTVYHSDAWSLLATDRELAAVDEAHRAVLRQGLRRSRTAAGAELIYIPVPMPAEATFAQIATRHAKAYDIALGGKAIDAPVVHAHVGMPAGWAALKHLRPDARFFVTEHASFLDKILAEPQAREMYAKVMGRCEVLFVVGDGVQRQLAEAFPQFAGRIRLMPNPISFDVPRPKPVTELRRWLFVGGLIERKGANWLLAAFAQCQAEEPTLTLDLVGAGHLRPALREQATELGIARAVTFHGSLQPDQVTALMRERDLLVHPSRHETFGMVVVEAVAAGMPVLATRCGGPEYTLAGVEDAVAELIPVEESERAIVDGYRRLRARVPHALDFPRAHRVLAERYGYPAVARAHHGVWFAPPGEAAPDGAAGTARAVGVGQTPRNHE